MRVGLVLEQCLAPVPGGTGRYSREIAHALATTSPPGSTVEGVTAWHRQPLQLADIPVRRLLLPRRALVAAWSGSGRPRLDADVVHAPTPLHPRKQRGQRLVVGVHDAVPWTHPETLTPRGVRWHRAMVERAAAEADLVVVPTHAVAKELGRHVGLREVAVVGEGVSADLALPPDADERAARMGLPEQYLLTVATLEPRKGLADLVAALPAGVPLLVAGQQGWRGVDPTALEQTKGVHVLGQVPDADLAVLLRRAAALVVPSLAEGFGLPLLEGMAVGTPVVTTDVPALVEVAGGAALAVPRRELGEALRAVLDDDALRARLRREGPLRAAHYTWEGAARALWDAYQPSPTD
ncbi:MAG TPA: glycosyltransferase family 1 protein [Mycobacteriales bacterium]|nr:glycosyltransferase family 1 protein [Mycobacteriales bacterium]